MTWKVIDEIRSNRSVVVQALYRKFPAIIEQSGLIEMLDNGILDLLLTLDNQKVLYIVRLNDELYHAVILEVHND